MENQNTNTMNAQNETTIRFINMMQPQVDRMIANYEAHDYSEYAKYIYEMEAATTLDECYLIYGKFSNEIYSIENKLKINA